MKRRLVNSLLPRKSWQPPRLLQQPKRFNFDGRSGHFLFNSSWTWGEIEILNVVSELQVTMLLSACTTLRYLLFHRLCVPFFIWGVRFRICVVYLSRLEGAYLTSVIKLFRLVSTCATGARACLKHRDIWFSGGVIN